MQYENNTLEKATQNRHLIFTTSLTRQIIKNSNYFIYELTLILRSYYLDLFVNLIVVNITTRRNLNDTEQEEDFKITRNTIPVYSTTYRSWRNRPAIGKLSGIPTVFYSGTTRTQTQTILSLTQRSRQSIIIQRMHCSILSTTQFGIP